MYVYSVAIYLPTWPALRATISFDNFVTSQTPTGASNNGFQLGVNYVVFNNLTTDGNGNIACQFEPPAGQGVPDGYINGFQLITPSGGGTTPEPGTLTLLAAGLAGLLCYAWRKRR
jgi:hypothetical protein